MSKNSIFYDLGIESSDSLSNPAGFSKRVQEKALFLREQLSRNTSIRVSERTEKFRNAAADDKQAYLDAEQALQEILDIVGGLTENAKVHLTTLLPKLGNTLRGDIEGAAFDAYRSEADDEPMDKKTTHMLYIELRRVYNLWVSFQNAFIEGNTPKYAELTAIPGNFSPTANGIVKTKIIYTFDVDGLNFISHAGLQRYLNQKFPSLNLILFDKMGAIEWVNENPEYEVTIKEFKV